MLRSDNVVDLKDSFLPASWLRERQHSSSIFIQITYRRDINGYFVRPLSGYVEQHGIESI